MLSDGTRYDMIIPKKATAQNVTRTTTRCQPTGVTSGPGTIPRSRRRTGRGVVSFICYTRVPREIPAFRKYFEGGEKAPIKRYGRRRHDLGTRWLVLEFLYSFSRFQDGLVFFLSHHRGADQKTTDLKPRRLRSFPKSLSHRHSALAVY